MFKSKWQKRYEKVYERAVLWQDFYRRSRDEAAKDEGPWGAHYQDIYSAQAIAMSDMITDIKKIRES